MCLGHLKCWFRECIGISIFKDCKRYRKFNFVYNFCTFYKLISDLIPNRLIYNTILWKAIKYINDFHMCFKYCQLLKYQRYVSICRISEVLCKYYTNANNDKSQSDSLLWYLTCLKYNVGFSNLSSRPQVLFPIIF